jgi:hypothetical protein
MRTCLALICALLALSSSFVYLEVEHLSARPEFYVGDLLDPRLLPGSALFASLLIMLCSWWLTCTSDHGRGQT